MLVTHYYGKRVNHYKHEEKNRIYRVADPVGVRVHVGGAWHADHIS